MTEKYDDIIEEIHKADEASFSAFDYCEKHQCFNDRNDSCTTDMAIHLCERVRKAVAGDPHAWFVLDLNDNELHIGDKFTDPGEDILEVVALGDSTLTGDNEEVFDASICEKVVPDTMEEILSDLSESLSRPHVTDEEAMELAKEYALRFKKVLVDE